MANYTLTQKAVDDLTEIWDYTFDEWSEEQADRYYKLLLLSCEEIAKKNVIGKEYPEILKGLRGFKSNKHIIFYIKLEENIEVIRILHESMDLKNRIIE